MNLFENFPDLLFATKLIKESKYWHGTGRICNYLNRLLHEVLRCEAANKNNNLHIIRMKTNAVLDKSASIYFIIICLPPSFLVHVSASLRCVELSFCVSQTLSSL